MKKINSIIILSILIISYLSFIDINNVSAYTIIGNTVSFENQYGKLEVYPYKSKEILNQKQYYTLTWKYPDSVIDIMFCFNDTVKSIGSYSMDKVATSQFSNKAVAYENKQFYVASGISIKTGGTYKGIIEYSCPVGSHGEWFLHIKFHNDTMKQAFDTKRVISLDPWWDSSYGYLMGSSVSNAVVNYVIPINISYNTGGDLAMNSHCQTNFSDIRFLTEDNTTELYHWMEYSSSGNYALFWVNISDEEYVNCYYHKNTTVGNSSYNNPSNVFYMWENFTAITDWTNYGGGGFSVSGGIMTATSSASYRYMYKDIPTDDYLMKCSSNGFDGASGGYISVHLDNDLDTASWIFEANEHYLGYNGDMWVWNSGYSSASVTYPATYPLPDYNQWMKGYIEYNGDVKVNKHNNFNLASNIVNDANSEPTYIIFKLRGISSFQVKYDWLFVSKHSVVEPSFVSWTSETTYAEYVINLYNESPSNMEVVNGINLSYLSVELTVLNGLADSINISILADNGLFYTNDTSGVDNDSYSLNVFSANFSVSTLYMWYVNVTDGVWNVHFVYYFNTSQLVQYDNWQVIDYKVEQLITQITNVSNNINNVSINTNPIVTLLSSFSFDDSQFFLSILIAMWLYFIYIYNKEKNNIYAFCIICMGMPLGLILSGVSYYNSYPFGYLISFIIILISFLIPSYAMYKKKK